MKKGSRSQNPEKVPCFVPSSCRTHLTPERLQVQLLVPDEVITVEEKQSVMIYNDRTELYVFSHIKIKVQKRQLKVYHNSSLCKNMIVQFKTFMTNELVSVLLFSQKKN